MTRRRAPWSLLWDSMYEPRWETGAVVTIYAVLGALGIAMLVDPPLLAWLIAPALHLVCAVSLIAAAALGIPTAWRGWWQAETIAAWLWVLGAALLLLEVVGVEAGAGLRAPWITVAALAVVTIVGTIRVLRIRHRVWAPGRDPQMPEEERRQIRAAYEHRGSGRD